MMECGTIKSDGDGDISRNDTIRVASPSDVAIKRERAKSEVDALSKGDSKSVKQEPNSIITIEEDDEDEVQITGATSKISRRAEVVKAAKRKGVIELTDEEDDAPSSNSAKRPKIGTLDCNVGNHSPTCGRHVCGTSRSPFAVVATIDLWRVETANE
ncbi:hypothetical protein EJ03DRAFT_371708 [Teratosphaeria nubilosa]|uniref:Uncharacterized protein n=1 Tax=Teratosphaeria nubilosa TaxID=161662 RepID=A0A6G1LIK4_9PEZI|nr:hypothetical protein EJ03DRAFT_371708 [Teratosphaeria nubilosa]